MVIFYTEIKILSILSFTFVTKIFNRASGFFRCIDGAGIRTHTAAAAKRLINGKFSFVTDHNRAEAAFHIARAAADAF